MEPKAMLSESKDNGRTLCVFSGLFFVLVKYYLNIGVCEGDFNNLGAVIVLFVACCLFDSKEDKTELIIWFKW